MIDVFKIINGMSSVKLIFSQNSNTRGHDYKLYPMHVRYDIRKSFFANRVIRIWNGLSDHVVHAPSVDSFKGRLDRFWSGQELIYDWRGDIV
jgi:hypothetical protein